MVTPDTPIKFGTNIVRVGATLALTRNGHIPVYPVIQVIWPRGWGYREAMSILELGGISPKFSLCWHDREGTISPGKKKKYLSVLVGGTPWFTYRVPKSDRETFESLNAKWGMWMLSSSEQGSQEAGYTATIFNNGVSFIGGLHTILQTAVVMENAKSLRVQLQGAYDKAADFAEGLSPSVAGEFSSFSTSMAILNIPQVLEDIGGKLPWNPEELEDSGRVTKHMHDDIVDTYLMMLEFLHRAKRGLGSNLNPEERKFAGKTWNLLRQARIFEIAPQAYADLYHAVDVYVTEKLNDLQWIAPGLEPPPIKDSQLHVKRTEEHGRDVLFPSNLPFDICWLAFGGACIGLTEVQKAMRGIDAVIPCLTAGYLITDSGLVQEIIVCDRGPGNLPGTIIVTHRDAEHGWMLPNSYSPWIATWLIRTINSHQNTVVTQYKKNITKTASKFKKAKGKIGIKRPIPPMFYTVYMKDEVIHRIAAYPEKREKPKSSTSEKKHGGFSHRWDRRGGYAHRIYRGELPLPDDLELSLKRRGYTVYTDQPIDKWGKDVLKKKGVAPRIETEWMAIKRWWRRAAEKCGPEDKPYRPSTRRGTKGILAG